MSELEFKTATELVQLIRDRKVRSVDLVEYFIERIERLDGDINAVVVRDFERAREAARIADSQLAAGGIAGPLHGLPMTLKEAYQVAGLPTTWGFPDLSDNRADSDAVVVEKFKAAGAIIMGKTNLSVGLRD